MFSKRTDMTIVGDAKSVCNQAVLSVDEKNVKWEEFDIVVSIDIAVSKKITDAYPQVVWAYFITEGCMRSYKTSIEYPIDGYDLFLTQVRTLRNYKKKNQNQKLKKTRKR